MAAHILTAVNQKGGCGKTTSTVQLSSALAAAGERVLLIDLDPQAHATMSLGCAVGNRPSLVDVLLSGVPMREILVSGPGNIALAPATEELAEFEEYAVANLHAEHILASALQELDQPFDHVILDCPPRVEGPLVGSAVRASHTVMLVIECGAYALQGTLKAVRIVDGIAAEMDRPFALRALATLFDTNSRLSRELLMAMQSRFGPLLFDTVIRTSIRLRESAALGVPVHLLDRGCAAAIDFDYLAEEVRALVRSEPEQPAGRRRQRASMPGGQRMTEPNPIH